MTIWRMRIACWIPKATNTHPEYIIHIAFPKQQWLRERASMLRYTHIACLVYISPTQSTCVFSKDLRTKRLFPCTVQN